MDISARLVQSETVARNEVHCYSAKERRYYEDLVSRNYGIKILFSAGNHSQEKREKLGPCMQALVISDAEDLVGHVNE